MFYPEHFTHADHLAGYYGDVDSLSYGMPLHHASFEDYDYGHYAPHAAEGLYH